MRYSAWLALLFSLMALAPADVSAATFAPTRAELEAAKARPDTPPLDLSTIAAQVDSDGRRFYAVDDMRFDAATAEVDAALSGPKWPRGVLYYQFDQDVSPENRTKWLNAAAMWSAVAPVSFVEGTGNGNYVYVAAAAENSSYVGMIGGLQQMYIVSWDSPGIIAHEIGHALGLLHEHSRNDRETYVSILWSNMFMQAQHNFRMYSNVSFGNYDFDSVMHYPRAAFSQNGQNTIEPRPDYYQHLHTMGTANQPSVLDAQGIIFRYGTNDTFAYRFTLLQDAGSVTGNNTTATLEPGEPNHPPGVGRSVWYTWQAPRTESVRFFTGGSQQTIAVYTGTSVSSLTPVARSGSAHIVDFPAVAGTWYQIAVDAWGYLAPYDFTLYWRRHVLPPNDNFSNRQMLTAESGSIIGNNNPATVEPGEPAHGSYDSVQTIWYSFTAPASAVWNVQALGTFGGGLSTAIYTGDTVSSLTRVGSGGFGAIAGRTYHIVVYGSGAGATGEVSLRWNRELAQYSKKGDVDGNGVADFLWQNTRTGERVVWKLGQNGTFLSGHHLQTVAPEWRIGGSADFNLDGSSDIVWQNTATGERVIWLLRGGHYYSGMYLETISPEWEIASAGDFNADGFGDFVWQNTRTGERAIWFLRDGVFQSGIYIETIPPEWRIAGAGDFNGDRHADLVWQNINTGERVMWFLRNGGFQSGIYLQTVAPEWRIAATVDFNYDGYSDFVWQNINTGERVMWFLRNGLYQSGRYLQTIDREWDLATH